MIYSHSKIINYIISSLGENPTQKEIIGLMEKKGVKVKFSKNGRLAIFNYNQFKVDFSDPIVQESRGIIIDVIDWKVVCFPFRKFGNYGESYADDIDWDTAEILEKIDGSIVKLYYYNDQWNWATNSCISADEAKIQGTNKTFLDLIKHAINYNDINFNKLDKYNTYVFELVSPFNTIVIHYTQTMLYHLGTRSNLSGIEYNTNIGIITPKSYPIEEKNLDKVIELVESFNNTKCEHEGFVVRDANYNRIKVKNSLYLALHYSMSNRTFSKKRMVEFVLANEEEIKRIAETDLQFAVYYKYYDWKVLDFIFKLNLYMTEAQIYFKTCKDRKQFALHYKNDPMRSFAFDALKYEDIDIISYVRKLPIGRILPYIEDYEIKLF